MNNIIEYKGYQAIIEYSAEDATLFGKVLDVDDKIVFEIENPSEASEVFREIIDDYLEFCKENNKEPCKPYKGVFNVRISTDLHKSAVQAARRKNTTLNAFVESAIRAQVEKRSQPSIVNIYLNSVNEKKNYSNDFSKLPSPKLDSTGVKYSRISRNLSS